jgi:hypothetical protein
VCKYHKSEEDSKHNKHDDEKKHNKHDEEKDDSDEGTIPFPV